MDEMWMQTPCTLDQYLQSVEREILYLEAERSHYNFTECARNLGLTFRQMRYNAEKLGIKAATEKPRPKGSERRLGPYWPKLRMDALRMYGNRCQCCGASPQDGVTIHVDHIKPRHTYPHLAFDLDNLQVLCASCHQSKGATDETDWRPKPQS